MADWSELLPELVFEIAKALNFYEDFLSFWNVCSSWRSAIEGYKPDRLPCRFPSLMVPGEDFQDECKIYLLDGITVRKIQLPKGKLICRSSTAGWLLIIEQDTTDPKLFHPFSGRLIDLPKFDSLPGVYLEKDFDANRAELRKVFISENPTVEQDFCVMILWGSPCQFAFCRSGDTQWTHVKEGWYGMLEDLCYHEGKAYTFDCQGMIKSCDVNAKIETPKLLQVSKKPLIGFEDVIETDYDHILPWGNGKLLVVYHRGDVILDDNITEEQIRDGEWPWVFKTCSFWLFKCDLETGEWSKLDNLGNRAIFVGISSSFSVEACGYVKPNCIYFTSVMRRVKGSWLNNGIYHLSDGSIEPHFDVSSVGLFNKPMWIAPPSL